MYSLLIIGIIIFILTIRLSIRIIINYDLKKNLGELSFKLFGIKVFKLEFIIQVGYFNLKSKYKTIKVDIKFDKKTIKFIEDLKFYLLKNIYITEFELLSNICTKNKLTLVNLQNILIAVEYIIYYKMIQNNYNIKIRFNNAIDFLNEKINFKFKIKFFISLLDIVLAFVKALFRRRFIYGKWSKLWKKS